MRHLQLTSEVRRENPDIETEMSKLKDRYTQLVVDIKNHYVAKMKYKDFKLSLGPAVNPFADLTDADILIFSTGAGYINSTGENTKNFFKSILIGTASLGAVIPIYAAAGGEIHLSVVDGDNGDILWHNFSPPNVEYNLTREKTVQKIVKAVLAKYPKREAFGRDEMSAAKVTGKSVELLREGAVSVEVPTRKIETPIRTSAAPGGEGRTDPAQMVLASEQKAS